MSRKALIVEDSKVYTSAISRRITQQLAVECDVAGSCKEARALLDRGGSEYFIAVLDLVLPDAPNGEIVGDIVARRIPAVVLTGDFSDETRESILPQNVVDYILKQGPSSVDQLMDVVARIWHNLSVKVLVVDDSKVTRITVRRLLETQRYTVLEAASGKSALKILADHPDIKIVITDYAMPKMDGIELTALIRARFPMQTLAIIGLSAHMGVRCCLPNS